MKRFLYLFCSQWQWARKMHGGRWVKRTIETPTLNCPGQWVTWNIDDYPLGPLKDHWPLSSDYDCEEYPR